MSMDETSHEESSSRGSNSVIRNDDDDDDEEFNSNGEEEIVNHSSESESESSPIRRKNKGGLEKEKDDRISGLEENVLLHILSFLSTKDAIKTCVLSKRWTDLWTCVPCLSFILRPSEFMDGFVKLVESTLILNRSSKIFKFHLDMQARRRWFHGYLDPKVLDMWIRFATGANVEELSVFSYKNFYKTKEVSSPNGYYLLPRHIFACSSLTKLNLSLCDIVPHGVITWTFLKSLSIKDTELSESVIQQILSGSPALEVLEICKCFGLNRLDITCASLKKLVIKDYLNEKETDEETDTNLAYNSLEIFAPYIQSLEILGKFRTKCRPVKVSSLVTAHIGFELALSPRIDDAEEARAVVYTESQNILIKILAAVQHVREMTFDFFCFQILTTVLEVRSLCRPLSNWKSLTLKAMIRKRELLGLARLLQNLPHLETLTIDPSTCECNEDFLEDYIDDDYKTRKMSQASNLENIFKNLLMHDLKTVKIVGSHACNEKQIISLAEFLLKNAKVLETMAFGVSKHECNLSSWIDMEYNTENLLKVAQKLLSFPRSSPHANIMFSW